MGSFQKIQFMSKNLFLHGYAEAPFVAILKLKILR